MAGNLRDAGLLAGETESARLLTEFAIVNERARTRDCIPEEHGACTPEDRTDALISGHADVLEKRLREILKTHDAKASASAGHEFAVTVAER